MDCPICDAGLVLSFTDLHGEAACIRCGTPFMCAGYNDRTETTCAILEPAWPALRAYWTETGRQNGLGTWLMASADVRAQRVQFGVWCDAHQDLLPAPTVPAES